MLINGTSGGETIDGTEDSDVINGMGGDDSIFGNGGSDVIDGGPGSDTLTGGAGDDTFVFSARNFGNDVITDFVAGDRIDLSALHVGDLASVQPFINQSGADTVISFFYFGQQESITLNNVVASSLTADSFIFDSSIAPLTISGTTAADLLFGGNGADDIFGGLHVVNDTIVAGGGADRIDGGLGNDRLTGGGGADVFVFSSRDFGADVVTDFTAGDRIDLTALNVANLASLQPFISQIGPDTVISLLYNSVAQTITLRGVTASSLTNADFVFSTSTAPQTITGSDSTDVIFGGLGDDRIDSNRGNDIVTGNGGNDVFVFTRPPFGNHVITDFSSGDRIDLSALHIPDLATLQPFITQNGADAVITIEYSGRPETITLRGIDASSLTAADFIFDTDVVGRTITGTADADQIFGANGPDHIDGGTGNDRLTGGGGADIFIFSAVGFGADVISDFTSGDRIDLSGLHIADISQLRPFLSQSGADAVLTFAHGVVDSITIANVDASALTSADFIFNISTQPLTLTGTNNNDILFGGNGADQISGGFGDDILVGGAGDDVLDGGAGGVDVLIGGLGADTLRGGAGNNRDTASYADDQGAIFVNLTTGLGYGGAAQGDTYVSIENITGTSFDDFIIGDNNVNALSGMGGNDTLIGSLGADAFDGGSGNDTVSYIDNQGPIFINLTSGHGYGNAAEGDTFTGIENITGGLYDDFIIGDNNANRLSGMAGNDTLIGSLGADAFDGGSGIDTVSYIDNQGPIFINLTTGLGYNNAAEGDTFTGVENITGGIYNDFIIGDAGANRFEGGAGNDTLIGAGGADTFVFNTALNATTNVDTISDFAHGQDHIELDHAIFAALGLGALSNASFVAGTAATTASQHIIYDSATGSLYYDADGSGAGAAVLFATLSDHPATVTAADFVVA